MLDYWTMELMHLHGGERVPMVERSHHDAADHDPEQTWLDRAKIFRCTTCDEEVMVLPRGRDGQEAGRA